MTPETTLGELARLFAKLGITAFGGPAAHVAMMRTEVVERRQWMNDAEFMGLVAATHLIPGPNSTELAIHIGYARRGFVGLVVAGACFIIPAMLCTLAVAMAYVRYGALPQGEAVLYGLKPIILGIVAHAIWQLARTTLGLGAAAQRPTGMTILRWLIAAAVFAGAMTGADEVLSIFAAGAVFAVIDAIRRRGPATAAPLLLIAPPLEEAARAATTASVGGLFFVFTKIGSVLFGSGYVLLAFLRSELVLRRGWLSEAQLLDAVAAGQITPGPVFTTATFVGYLLEGVPGALAATGGIFLPAFVFVALSAPLLARFRNSSFLSSLLDGIATGSWALMAAVCVRLAHAAVVDETTFILALFALAMLSTKRLGATALLGIGAAVGVLKMFAS